MGCGAQVGCGCFLRHRWGVGCLQQGIGRVGGRWGGGQPGFSPIFPWTGFLSPCNLTKDRQIWGAGAQGSEGHSLFVCLLSAISLKVGCRRRGGSGGGREAARGGEDGRGRSGCKNDSVSSAAARPLRLRCQRPGMYSSPLCLTQVRTPRPPGPSPHPGSTWNHNFADWNLPSAAGVGKKKGARTAYPPPSRPGCSWLGPGVRAVLEIGDPLPVKLGCALGALYSEPPL